MSHPIPHLYHFHSNSNRRTSPRRPIGSKRRQGDPLPCIEPLEGRVLLSGYALSTLGVFAPETTGSQPNNVIVDASGDLYGTTTDGGDANGDGTVFEIAHGSGTITTLASFDGANGMDPNT